MEPIEEGEVWEQLDLSHLEQVKLGTCKIIYLEHAKLCINLEQIKF